jgi:hypothetical protein
MGAQEVLSRLSVLREEGPYANTLIMLDDEDGRGTQIGLQDGLNILMSFSDEALLENAELPEEDVKVLQEHQDEIIAWVQSQGYTVEVED